jgi:hypothetical protein
MKSIIMQSPGGVNQDQTQLGHYSFEEYFNSINDWAQQKETNHSIHEFRTYFEEHRAFIEQCTNRASYIQSNESCHDGDYKNIQEKPIINEIPLKNPLLFSSFSHPNENDGGKDDDGDDDDGRIGDIDDTPRSNPSIQVKSSLPLKSSMALDISHLTQRNLTLAFIRLVYFCQCESTQLRPLHHQKPVELLRQLENMLEEFSKWHNLMKQFDSLTGTKKPSIDTSDIQQKLANIVFGKNIAITNSLLSSWTMICLWVHQGQTAVKYDATHLRQQRLSEKWMQFGATSFYIAKRTCGLTKSYSSNNNSSGQNIK